MTTPTAHKPEQAAEIEQHQFFDALAQLCATHATALAGAQNKTIEINLSSTSYTRFARALQPADLANVRQALGIREPEPPMKRTIGGHIQHFLPWALILLLVGGLAYFAHDASGHRAKRQAAYDKVFAAHPAFQWAHIALLKCEKNQIENSHDGVRLPPPRLEGASGRSVCETELFDHPFAKGKQAELERILGEIDQASQ